eukprot:4804675-Prorocentrum_lima.AAC.1
MPPGGRRQPYRSITCRLLQVVGAVPPFCSLRWAGTAGLPSAVLEGFLVNTLDAAVVADLEAGSIL